MDFVVIGLGLSALALLTGLTLLCLVAPHWFRKAGAAQPGDAAYARAQAGERRAIGQGFLCTGAVLLLSTLGGISAGLTDKSGAYLIATMATLAMLGLYGWALLYRRQHPVPARRRPASTRATRTGEDARSAHSAATPPTSLTTTSPVRHRVLPARQRIVATTPTAAAMTAPEDAEHRSGMAEDEQHPGLLEAAEAGEHEVIVSDLAASMSPDPEPGTGLSTPGTTFTNTPEGDEVEGADAEANVPTAEGLPEEGALGAASTNGAAEPEASPSTLAEPEVLPHGDDRVIAFFPTAATQRRRMVVAPTDSDGQS